MEEAMSWKENTGDNSEGRRRKGLFSLSVVNNARKDLGFLPVSPPSAPPLPAAGFSATHPTAPLSISSQLRSPALTLSRATDGNTGCRRKGSSSMLHLPGSALLPQRASGTKGLGGAQRRTVWLNAGVALSPTSALVVIQPELGGNLCLYFARGYCKNGNSCRFLHGLSDDTAEVISGKMDAVVEEPDLLLRSKSQRIMSSAASAFPYPAAGSLPHSPSSNGKCMNFLFQQQQSDCQRRVFLDKMTSFFTLHLYKTRRFCQLYRTAAAAASAAATALILGGEDTHNFIGRPRMERQHLPGGGRLQLFQVGFFLLQLTLCVIYGLSINKVIALSRSIYGPVQDVRIPYQQKDETLGS
ncbi:hypothetical protein HPP92_001469 [Vanilla planifolia]|uniref:C3H1-type domain-containing protein n=1 Tax=Vanilla planifolia TaxID=51239 RepID=A0A835VJP7_VANPL|nr:hypothetical protein HPP92_001469 [Vanilla planifolia]